MKKIIALLVLTISSVALADQCQLMDKEVGERAKLLLKNNSEIIQFCKPCGDKLANTKVEVVRNIKAINEGGYIELKLNNNPKVPFDMAYTYVKVAPNMFVNVAKVVGCPATDVPASISK